MTLSSAGRITWVPQANQIGPHVVRFSAVNASGGIASQAFTVEAIQQRPNLGPQFSSVPERIATADQDYRYTAVALDPDQERLVYGLAFAPRDMSIDPQTGSIAWKPTTAQLGLQRIQISATDSRGAVATQTFAIDVRRTNSLPAFVSSPIVAVMAGDSYRYNALASDSDDHVTYSLFAGPTSGINGMQIDPRSGAITWQPRPEDVGNYDVIVRATDERGGFADQNYSLSVVPDRNAPVVSIRLEKPKISVGESTRIEVRAFDPNGVESVSLEVNGRAVTLEPDGTFVFTASISGIPRIVASAIDLAGNRATITADPALHVLDATDVDPPVVSIASPINGSRVTYLTDVVGTVTDRNLAFYELQYALANSDQWITFARREFQLDATSDGVRNAALGVFDPTLLANDAYQLRVIAQDVNGAESTAYVELSVESQAKIGNYHYDAVQKGCTECRTGFSDLEVNVAGIPISIQRSYDTLDANFVGDFGYGWRMSITNPRIRESVRPSLSELSGAGPLAANPFRVGTRVYMNVPDGRRVGFTFDPIPAGGLLGTVWTPRFLPDPGVKYQLEVENTPLSQNTDGSFGLYLLNLPYNPDRYTLVSKDQLRMTYSQFSPLQLESVADRNGVELTFTKDGIFSSLGPKVVWERDSQNRITSITDPAGNVLQYRYNSDGDLVEFENQVGNLTRMSYLKEPAHFLQSVTDPRGFEVIKLAYDADHRIVGLTNALGETETRRYEIDNNTEVVSDVSGSETTLVFDDRGNITRMTDPLGGVFETVFNEDDEPIRLTDANGGITEVTYDERSNVTQVIDALGNVWRTTYNARNDRTSAIDPNGKQLTFEYDERGNLVKSTDQLGRTNALKVDTTGRTTSLTNAAGQTWLFAYGSFDKASRITNPDGTFRDVALNSWGEMVGVTDENGVTYRFERDAANRVTSVALVNAPAAAGLQSARSDTSEFMALRVFLHDVLVEETDALGRVTRYHYDAKGRIDEITDPMGGKHKTIYDSANRTFDKIDALGNRTHHEYDRNGRLTRVVNAAGGVTHYTFDSLGNLFQVVDEAGFVTKHTYDLGSRRTKTELPDGSTLTFEYDAFNNITRATGPRGEVSRYFYDDAHQLTKMIDPEQGVYQWGYDATGNPTRFTDPRGNVSSHLYDGRNRLVLSTDALGYSERFSYDGLGRALSYIDQVGAKTEFQYDSRGNMIRRVNPDGGISQYEYDAVGNETKATDPLGRTTLATYDDLDRMISTTDPRGSLTKFRYDAMSNLIALTDASDNTTSWTYDSMNRVVLWTDPLGASESFTYDDAIPNSNDRRGNLSVHTDRLGRRKVYAYDARNRNTSVEWLDASGSTVDSVVRQYDRSSNLIGISDGDSRLSFTYDLVGRLLDADNDGTAGVRRVILSSSWDAAGNRVRVQDNDGVRVDSTYDVRNMLATRTWSNSGALAVVQPASVRLAYNGRGQLTELQRFSSIDSSQQISKTRRAYDVSGRIEKISHLSAIDTVMAEFSSEWDVADQLMSWTVDGETTNYQYDASGQLLSAQRLPSNSLDETYTYDASGNRTSSVGNSSPVIGANNRLLADSHYAYSYDAEGNLIERRDLANGVRDRYEYDHANHLIRFARLGGTGEVLSSVTYRYDALGRRIARSVDPDGAGPKTAHSEYFVYDGMHVWMDSDESGHVTARYLFSDEIDEPLARYRPGEGTVWYLTDHLGSVRNLVDSVGTVVDTIDYDSFGNIVSESSPQLGDRYKYTGREWDEELELYYYRARYYSPETGRFTSEDPISFWGGQTNLNTYVGNSPTIYVDPSGLIALGEYVFGQNFGEQVQRSATGAAVGATLGYACGFIEGWYRTGTVEGAHATAVHQAQIGAGAGAVLGFLGASQSVWARYFSGILGIAGASLAIYNGEDLAVKTIRTSCGVIGFGVTRAAHRSPTPSQIAAANPIQVIAEGYGQAAEASFPKQSVGGLVLWKSGSQQAGNPNSWRDGDHFLVFPLQSSTKANWRMNARLLRSAMRDGRRIYDSYTDENGNLIEAGGFLNMERQLLINHGWRYNPSDRQWLPPTAK